MLGPPSYLTFRSSCVMDCHATTEGSIPGGYGVKTELHVLRKGQYIWPGVPSLKKPRCRWDVKHYHPIPYSMKFI